MSDSIFASGDWSESWSLCYFVDEYKALNIYISIALLAYRPVA